MKKIIAKLITPIFLSAICIINSSWTFKDAPNVSGDVPTISFLEEYMPFENPEAFRYEIMYDSMHLDAFGLSEKAFQYALHGFDVLKQRGYLANDSILTIVDFDQPSYNKRMYVVDVKNLTILFNTWAAHGKNSGKEMAVSFSNRYNSNKSSLGFYITDNPYNGSNGYSLKLIGLEKGVNDLALKRAIVLHGAPYVSQQSIDRLGYIGRSWGCPAVPQELCRPIINTVKGGTCLFIYSRFYHPSKYFDVIG